MGTTTTVDLVAGVPLELARHILGAVVPQQPAGDLRTGLRPIFHYPRSADETSTPRIKGELRLPTAQRALRNFAFAARHLREHGIDALDLTVRGRPGDADLEFLHALSPVIGITLRLEASRVSAAPESDPESRRVIADRDAVVSCPPGERTELWCRTLARYMAGGDPWTARWISEQVLDHGITPEPEVAAVIATAYLYSDAVHIAEGFARIALRGDARVRALGLYDLAIMELRYLPRGLRNLDAVPQLLAEAAELLATQPFADVASEFVLVQNAHALHLLTGPSTDDEDGNGSGVEACRVLERAIETVVARGFAGTTAHAILLNNYGRALDRTFGDEQSGSARTALERSVEIEGGNPDGWLDLAQFLARHEMLDAAVAAARTGLDVLGAGEVLPELWDTLGYCLARLGHPCDAADAYAAGVRVGGDREVLGLARTRQLLAAGRTDQAADALAELAEQPGVDREQQSEIAVLQIAAEAPTDPADTVERLEGLTARFPESELVRANLAAAREWLRTADSAAAPGEPAGSVAAR